MSARRPPRRRVHAFRLEIETDRPADQQHVQMTLHVLTAAITGMGLHRADGFPDRVTITSTLLEDAS